MMRMSTDTVDRGERGEGLYIKEERSGGPWPGAS